VPLIRADTLTAGTPFFISLANHLTASRRHFESQMDPGREFRIAAGGYVCSDGVSLD